MFKLLGAFLQKIIDLVGAALTFLAALFPDSPFQIIAGSEFSSLISQINFFLPVYEFIAIGQAWLIAIGIYYLYATFARWMKAID
jgi:hypothetical protein